MHVSTKPNVVGKVPARMIGVVVDNDLVAIPEPAAAIVDVVGRHAEEKTAEVETVRTPARQSVDVVAANRSAETPVFPGVV